MAVSGIQSGKQLLHIWAPLGQTQTIKAQQVVARKPVNRLGHGTPEIQT